MIRKTTKPYLAHPQDWPNTPIKRRINPITGFMEGEDGPNPGIGNPGYRGMRTLFLNNEPLVTPADVECRPNFDGFDEYGNEFNPELVLPGGVEKGQLLVREMVAATLDHAQHILDDYFAGEYRLVAIDGFRSATRQAAGFTRHLIMLLKEKEIENPSLYEFYKYGIRADANFSWVNANISSKEYQGLEKELRADDLFMQQVLEIARKKATSRDQFDSVVSDIIFEIISISANSNIGPAKDRNIPLDFECNPHAGGGAVDLMMVNVKGRLLNKVPYENYSGPESGMDYMEMPGAYGKFINSVSKNVHLKEHLVKLGFPSPDKFTRSHWESYKMAMRVRYHLMKALGCTYFSAHDPMYGGEDWHFEPDGVALYGLDGRLIKSSDAATQHFPYGSGNPSHTLQKLGKDEFAVYGGASAHKIAREKHGLDSDIDK